jgi:transglutaminase-like putative cysteine protease
MTILTVRHVTTYRYRRPIAFGDHRMMFRPRDSYDQRLIDSRLRITPEPAHIHWIHDPFGNCVALARFKTRASELRFESTIRVDHYPDNVPDFRTEPRAQAYPFVYDSEEMPDLMASIARGYPDPNGEIDHWVRKFLLPGRPTPTGQLLMTLTCAIKEGFTYTRRSEHGTQDPVVTVRSGRGSCRDFALLMMEAVRSLGLAARFVSGYLYVPSRDSGRASWREGRRKGAEHVGGGSTHAWCQVYLPGAGWVEFDPTNGIIGNRDLIRVAVARDPSQAVPLSGTYAGSPDDELGMKVQVNVEAEAETQSEDADAAGR